MGSKRAMILAFCGAFALTACGAGSGELAPQDPVGPQAGPKSKYDPRTADSVFGNEGLSTNTLRDWFGDDESERKGAIPVNKYLWQASLDVLSFLPLASTDPFTGVIATDWGVTPDAPNERFKVTAYLLNAELAASSLRVAVFRERLAENGVWVAAEVNPDTASRIEDAILTRARQIRLAADPTSTTG